jgi:NADH-quinone oxidoreductase subunit J
MAETVSFYAFAGLMTLAALSVVFNRQPVYSVLSLLVAMLCLAGLFVLRGAFVLAALQILLYAGAVLVLFLSVMMLLNLEPETLARMRVFTLAGIGTAVALLLGSILARLFLTGAPLPAAAGPADHGTIEAAGRLLFTTYLLPFELISFIILAAIIGAVTLAKQEHAHR